MLLLLSVKYRSSLTGRSIITRQFSFSGFPLSFALTSQKNAFHLISVRAHLIHFPDRQDQLEASELTHILY